MQENESKTTSASVIKFPFLFFRVALKTVLKQFICKHYFQYLRRLGFADQYFCLENRWRRQPTITIRKQTLLTFCLFAETALDHYRHKYTSFSLP